MLTIPIPPYRRRHVSRRRVDSPEPAPPPAPVLVAGHFGEESGLQLTFDRTVAVTGFDGTALVVIYPVQSQKYNASGTPVVSGVNVQMSVSLIGAATGTHATLDATAGSGIVGAEGGTPWAGISGFVLSTK